MTTVGVTERTDASNVTKLSIPIREPNDDLELAMQSFGSGGTPDEAATTLIGLGEQRVTRAPTCTLSKTRRTNRGSLGAVVASAILALATPGCGCPDAWYEWLAESPKVFLPHDEARHCYSAEWWY